LKMNSFFSFIIVQRTIIWKEIIRQKVENYFYQNAKIKKYFVLKG
jgi:hypothetical protein